MINIKDLFDILSFGNVTTIIVESSLVI